MTENKNKSISAFVSGRNSAKHLFTPGPASLLAENITGLRPCFGRGDSDYQAVHTRVLELLKDMSGHERLVALQGSASLALEIMAYNFLAGKVLVVSTGYYSDRLGQIAGMVKETTGLIEDVAVVDWQDIESLQGKFDWVLACPTETSIGFKLPIEWLSMQADRLQAKLMLDATASIGLENGHEMADALAYSSCKGLFGLTGAAFIAYNDLPLNGVNSFYLDLQNHIDKKMTGPYHAVASLLDVLPRHADFREAVVINKKRFCTVMKDYLVYEDTHQPLLCTFVNAKLRGKSDQDILYQSRAKTDGQVVSHLGEVHLGKSAAGEILDSLLLGEQ